MQSAEGIENTVLMPADGESINRCRRNGERCRKITSGGLGCCFCAFEGLNAFEGIDATDSKDDAISAVHPGAVLMHCLAKSRSFGGA